MATVDIEKKRAKWRRKYARNPEKYRARAANSNHRRRAAYAVSDITASQESEMRRRTRKCRICGTYMTSKPGKPNSKHLDHILPINMRGTHTHGNVRIICRTCNLKRPDDGSDYTGQLTLWAQAPGVMLRPKRVILKPRPAPRPPRTCKCGASFAAPGGTLMCPECNLKAVRTAAYLRMADELAWHKIAAQVGYSTATGIRDAVVRVAPDLATPRPQPKPKPVALCSCGEQKKYGRCEGCTWLNGLTALALRTSGMTSRQVADRLGYSSITTVTNLMKSVATVETRMGRPRSGSQMVIVKLRRVHQEGKRQSDAVLAPPVPRPSGGVSPAWTRPGRGRGGTVGS